eukprot:Lithocolla_globosa_v1_NODE_3805_length_1573_cov_183.231073.p2 type:complete len:154 gc:universal NODE_3805_length_1573_cov_183.231073:818-1279(+)
MAPNYHMGKNRKNGSSHLHLVCKIEPKKKTVICGTDFGQGWLFDGMNGVTRPSFPSRCCYQIYRLFLRKLIDENDIVVLFFEVYKHLVPNLLPRQFSPVQSHVPNVFLHLFPNINSVRRRRRGNRADVLTNDFQFTRLFVYGKRSVAFLASAF